MNFSSGRLRDAGEQNRVARAEGRGRMKRAYRMPDPGAKGGLASRFAGLAAPRAEAGAPLRPGPACRAGEVFRTLKGTEHHGTIPLLHLLPRRAAPSRHGPGAVPALRRRVAHRPRPDAGLPAVPGLAGEPCRRPHGGNENACIARDVLAMQGGLLSRCQALTWDGRHTKPLPLACMIAPVSEVDGRASTDTVEIGRGSQPG